MNAGDDTALREPDSFESLLDNACSRLWDRKLRYTLKRIGELGGVLDKLDQELEEMLLQGNVPAPVFISPAPVNAPSAEAAPAGSEVP
jgi:hypothetical protein